MSQGEIDICNQALGWLGANLITSFDDQSKEANLCQANYSYLRDAVQECAEWSFCIKRVELAELSDSPLGYGVAYQIPDDCLRVVSASKNGQFTVQMEWVLEDRKILTNNGSCYIRYISRIEDPVRFSPNFVTALAYRIAADLAIPLTKSRTLQQQMLSIYEKRVDEAMGMDGMQGRTRRMRSSWSDSSRRGANRGEF